MTEDLLAECLRLVDQGKWFYLGFLGFFVVLALAILLFIYMTSLPNAAGD